ncbi:MAG: TldD/PmbA family protein [Deltaproteobacteria bacterium]|nr:TldD/PmbA family protein [Deltaproteobacteria bacterium]
MQQVTPPSIDALLAALAASRADSWEVYLRFGRELTLALREGEIEELIVARPQGVGVRTLWRGRLGSSFTTCLEESDAEEAVAMALEAAAASASSFGMDFVGPAEVRDLPSLELFDPALLSLTTDDRVARLAAVERAARGADPAVQGVREVRLKEDWQGERLVTSRGVDLAQLRSILSFQVSAVARRADDDRVGWEGASGFFWDQLPLEELGARVGARAAAALGAGPVPTGRYDVLFEPWPTAQLMEALGKLISIEAVRSGRSVLAGRLGQRVFSRALTLVDDGLDPRGTGAACFDGEGTPQQTTVVAHEGELRSFLYNRDYGRAEGRRSTGNTQREDYGSPPVLGPTNLYFRPGPDGPAELLGGLGEGLLIDEILDIDAADSTSGAFSFGVTGRRVRNGAPAEGVTGVTISGTLLELLDRARAVGRDLRFFNNHGGSSLLVEGVFVAG